MARAANKAKPATRKSGRKPAGVAGRAQAAAKRRVEESAREAAAMEGGGEQQIDAAFLTSLYGLTSKVEAAIVMAIADDNTQRARALVTPLHPADRADLLERLNKPQRQRLYRMIGPAREAETLTYLDKNVMEEVLAVIGADETAKALPGMDSDDAIDILGEMDHANRENILAAMPLKDRVFAEEGLSYPEGSAGRLMQREVVAVPFQWTVGRLLDYLRSQEEKPAVFHSIFVTDNERRAVGQVMLSQILVSQRTERLSELMETAPHQIIATLDQKEVAQMFKRYGLVSAAVVDQRERIVGMITVDDVVAVIDATAGDDMMAMGQVSDVSVHSKLMDTIKSRFAWLLVNLGTAVAASVVIGLFDDTIEQLVALAVLMPIVASMGGNAGTQTITVAVRAIAMRQLSAQTVWGFVMREGSVGLLNGVVFAVTCGLISWLWFGNVEIALVMAAAMLFNLVVAGLSGALIPLTLDRLGVDPAVASTVFITTVTDVVGFISFLGLATLFLI